MLSLLMLGIIPGTNIQIDFDSWLRVVAVLCTIAVTMNIRRRPQALSAGAVRAVRSLRHSIKPTARPAQS